MPRHERSRTSGSRAGTDATMELAGVPLLRSPEGGYCLGGDSIRSMLAFSAPRRSSESSLSDWSRAVETASAAISDGAVPGGGHAFTASDQRKSLLAVALWQFMHPVPTAA